MRAWPCCLHLTQGQRGVMAGLRVFILATSLATSIGHAARPCPLLESGKQMGQTTRASVSSQSAPDSPATIHIPGKRNPPQPARPGGIDSLDPVAGYLCTAERQLWVQTKPCPPAHLPKPNVQPSLIRQRPLNRQTLCKYLTDGARIGKDWSASHQSKERSTLLKMYSCRD